ncbi:hypothetical protein ACH4TE_15230 [Streptomyces sioyaensis]|uniref:hypothetical protein n=1 Tax=Streptomyces sioyaensis TaxID=67364 RepID=UPI0037BDA2F9
MFESSPPRLLPWTRADGAPCYLSTDDPHSRLSQLADDVEEELLTAAETLLAESETKFAAPDPEADPQEQDRTAVLHAALRDVLRIAVSRGDRLPEPCDHGETRLCEGRTCCRVCRRQIYL